MNTFYTPQKSIREEKAGITTTSEGENESLLSFSLNPAGEKKDTEQKPSFLHKIHTLLQQTRSLTRACMHQLRVPLEKNRPQIGITTTSEKADACLHASALSAVGAKPASSKNAAGFTILFAVIIVSVVTLLGATIAGIYQREARLRATSQASSEAFYAADSALECAMLHDRKTSAFATSSASGNVNCGGDSVSVSGSGSSYPYEFTFELNDTHDANICAGVTVIKDFSGGRETTRIESRGRDTCSDSDRQAERALKTAY